MALLSCVLFPGARVPAVCLEKFSKLFRCRPHPTKGRGESCALPPGGCWTCSGAQGSHGLRGCALPALGGGAVAARWLRSGAAPAGSQRRQASGEPSSGCWREETGGGGRRRGGRGAGRGPRLGRGAPQPPGSGLCVSARAPAPFPSLERGGPRARVWGLRKAGRDARGSGRVSARGSGDAVRCGRGHLGDLSPGLQGRG